MQMLLSLLRGIGVLKRRPPPPSALPEPINKPEQVISLVAIDMENVRKLNHSTPWNALRSVIERDLEGTQCIYRGAFRAVDPRNDERGEFLRRSRIIWERKGYKFEPHAEKDIDIVIVLRVWAKISALLESHIGKPSKVRLILVSGDSDFAEMIENIRSTYRHRLDFDLVVYSRQDRLSQRLKDLAGPGNIRLIDDIPEFGEPEPMEI